MSILVSGDYCPNYRIAEMVSNSNYSFFDGLKGLTNSVDYSIVNLECPIADKSIRPITKCGPALHTSTNAIEAILHAGFSCVTLANNHFRDYGDDGCFSTMTELAKRDIDYVGGGENLYQAQAILYKQINGMKLAIINVCENEFSIATPQRAGAAPIDIIDCYNQISSAKANADYVLLITHGGHEHYQLPSPRMKRLYRHFIDLGADAVINHHQHCYSGYEFYKHKPIFYGLGNLCFDWEGKRNSIWNKGYCVIITYAMGCSSIELIPYTQCNDTPTILIDSHKQDTFDNEIKKLNSIINDDLLLKIYFENWVNQSYKSKLSLLASYHSKCLNAAASRGLLPRPWTNREKLSLLNNIACESHRDIVLSILETECKKI